MTDNDHLIIDLLAATRMTNRSATTPWHRSRHEVWQFARDMHKAGMFGVCDDVCDPADLMLDYFQTPWAWNKEHQWWEDNGRPDDFVTWDRYRP